MLRNSKMESAVWFRSELSDRIIRDDEIFKEIHNVVSDIEDGKLVMNTLVENMAQVLTNQEVELRARGMKFLTNILNALPKEYLSKMQLKFISKFYADRLRDNHRVIPYVLEGYLSIILMENYNIEDAREFLNIMFSEVPCQSQVRQDRYNIYSILSSLIDRNPQYDKTVVQDFAYEVILAIEGERDPRNLLFVFKFLDRYLNLIPLNLRSNFFEILSCYFPIDFHPNPDDPESISRNELAHSLIICLCRTHSDESCLLLIMEKLDSNLKVAKMDSLKLLHYSSGFIDRESYKPFIKAIWSSLWREICNKTDDELRMAAFDALFGLTRHISGFILHPNATYDLFLDMIINSMQISMAEANSVIDFSRITKVFLTITNASCLECTSKRVALVMIPSTIAYYSLNSTPKLQLSSLTLLGELAYIAGRCIENDEIVSLINESVHTCLDAASKSDKEYQIAAFETLKYILKRRVKIELIPPFIEILVKNIHNSKEDELLSKSIETIHLLAKKFPVLILDSVVKEHLELYNLSNNESLLPRRLLVLCNLASIDDFTRIIFEELIKMLNEKDGVELIKQLNKAMSNNELYDKDKIIEIERDFHIVDCIITWIVEQSNLKTIEDGLSLISNIVSYLFEKDQEKLLSGHLVNKIKTELSDADLLTKIAICISLRPFIYDDYFCELIKICLNRIFVTQSDLLRNYCYILLAHFVNKSDEDELNKMDLVIKENLPTKKFLLELYGYLTKGLVYRGSDLFEDKLVHIIEALKTPELCYEAADSVRVIMDESKDYLTTKYHCKSSFLYNQRIFLKFKMLTENFEFTETREAYLLCWAHILDKLPESLLVNEIEKMTSIVIDSLEYYNVNLITIMIGVLTILVKLKHPAIAQSMQTILPRLKNLSKCQKSMNVRIKSLDCLFEIGHNYPTLLLLPFKQDLLYDLAPCLDDKKRQVRTVAVRARTRWFLVGAPGEPD